MNAYLIMMALILLFFVIVSYFTSSNQSYTYQDMENVLELDNVSAATITPDQTSPTGSVSLRLKTGEMMTVYVTDVKEAESLLKSYDIYPVVKEPKGESVFSTLILPILISAVVFIIILSIMN